MTGGGELTAKVFHIPSVLAASGAERGRDAAGQGPALEGDEVDAERCGGFARCDVWARARHAKSVPGRAVVCWWYPPCRVGGC